jgi:hypothetical protein
MAYEAPGHIAVVNKSTTLADGEALLWIAAYQEEIKRLAEAWLFDPPGFALYPRTHEEPEPSVFAIYIVDTAGDPDALGYHTAVGRSRFGYLDMTLSAAYDVPSVVFGHEVFEGFVDADCARWVKLRDGSHVPVEVSDPVQRERYRVSAKGLAGSGDVWVSDWVTPGWFDEGAGVGPFDHQGRIYRPFECAPGGYYLVEQDGVVTSMGAVRVKNFGRTFRRLTEGRDLV